MRSEKTVPGAASGTAREATARPGSTSAPGVQAPRQFAEYRVVGVINQAGPVPTGLLQPDPFFRAVARGAAMNVDLLKDWDIWSVVDRPLPELRAAFQIPSLTASERTVRAESDALLV